MAGRDAEKSDRFPRQFVGFAGAVQTHEAVTDMLRHFRRLKLHPMLLERLAALIKEQECVAVVALEGIDHSNVQLFSRHIDLLSFVRGEGCSRLLVERDGLAELTQARKRDGLVATCARDMQVNAIAQQQIGLDGAVEEAQGLLMLPQFQVDNARVDIDLPGAQQLVMAHKNLTGNRGIPQRLGGAIELQAGADTRKLHARPANFIIDFQKFSGRRVEEAQRLLVIVHAPQSIASRQQTQRVIAFILCQDADEQDIAR